MKLTLKQKLIAASLSGAFFMAIALTWLSAHHLYNETYDSVYERAKALSITASDGIANWLSVKKEVTASVNDYVLNPNRTELVSRLKQARKAGGFDEIYFGAATGDMYRSHPERNRADYDPRKRPWYQDAVKHGQGQIVTEAYSDAITGALLITIAEPIMKEGHLWGVVGADVLIDQIVHDVLNLDAGKNADTMLIDSNGGYFLAHRDKKLTLKSVTNLASSFTMDTILQAAVKGKMIQLNIHHQPKWFYFSKVPDTRWIFAIEMDRHTEERAYRNTLIGLLTIAAVITVLVILILSWTVSFLTRDLRRVSDALAEIASGEGDLTQRLTPKNDDEVGQLAKNFNKFVGTMHHMVLELSRIAASLAEQASHAARHSNESNQRIKHQQNEINMVATAIHEMASATQEIAGNAEHTAESANKAVSACRDGAEQATKTQNSIGVLAKEMETARAVIRDLDEHGNKIGQILTTIQDIAEQTNLLALNAAIEAARAGEQGRGFAVVADEVRLLSQRTHASTEEIQQSIDILLSTTEKAVQIMSESQVLAGNSVDDANAAEQNLAQIREVVNYISDMAAQIATAAEEQASVTSEITRNTEGIRDVSNEFATEAEDSAKQSAELSRLSNALQDEIHQFKL
jgi:methyl-accepting chemotaxis protein